MDDPVYVHICSCRTYSSHQLPCNPSYLISTEDSKQERESSAKEVEELKQQLSKAAADPWLRLLFHAFTGFRIVRMVISGQVMYNMSILSDQPLFNISNHYYP